MQVSVHKRSVLLLPVFVVAEDATVEYAREGLINKILYAADVVLLIEIIENLN